MEINKQRIVTDYKTHLNERLINIQEDMRRLREAAGINADDNMSENYESNKQEMLNEMSDLQTHFEFLEESAALFNRIDYGSDFDEVLPGALVVTDTHVFLVGMSGEFLSDGKKIHGISTSAPIYAQMKNKKQGESFSVNGRTYQVREVY
ncbi:hypothetical protein [Arundinibacter roseus]|uniref:Transcription elongation factor n=1 Tax=Arundinibacter roseus TaxID=2070510 RepID=A0A4V6P8L4_9BACT|nr:hypothetical protein [Arundinibacter roseus]TDB63405.1 hypothetical protein EZE20_16705 [Arundinibacter roseus]